MVRVRKKGCGRSKEGGRGKVEWKDWWERNWREDYATVLNISQSKKTSEKGGRTHQKRVGARNARCKAGRGGGPTCTTRTSPLMQKKKKETPQSILYYSIHGDEGVQEAEGGGGGRFKRCMGSERNWGIYATMLSISQQQNGCVAVM